MDGLCVHAVDAIDLSQVRAADAVYLPRRLKLVGALLTVQMENDGRLP